MTAACMVVRRSVFDRLEGFNEDFAVAFNDVDFCIRIRQAGWRIVWTPQVTMYHHKSASLGKHNSPSRRALFDRETALMKELWGRLLEEDPFTILIYHLRHSSLNFPIHRGFQSYRYSPKIFRASTVNLRRQRSSKGVIRCQLNCLKPFVSIL